MIAASCRSYTGAYDQHREILKVLVEPFSSLPALTTGAGACPNPKLWRETIAQIRGRKSMKLEILHK